MKKMLILSFVAAVCLSSCSVPLNEIPSSSESSIQGTTEESGKYSPINYIRQTGLWIPYMEFEELMYGRSEDDFRRLIRQRFSDALDKGV
ncbi:MAG TPA: hypothetical protein PLS20_13645, partial [Ruminococcus flavefaciens]|nr:hypothetical protein [Ruminococcus flavefaciens]